MDFPIVATDSLLRDWSNGNTSAERLCADVLRLERFKGVDPQSPIGGPDGGKDLLCEKDGVGFVAACYFPNGQHKFISSREKFVSDLAAALKHGRDGFIFLTNQHLTPMQRSELETVASEKGKRCLIYHRERLRVVLDSPQGYGLRLRHLGIPLSREEQFAYFASSDENVMTTLQAQTRAIERLSGRVAQLADDQIGIAMHTAAVVVKAVRGENIEITDVPSMLRASASALRRNDVEVQNGFVSANLSAGLLRFIHRLLVSSQFTQIAGLYRQTQVWLADPTGKVNEDTECPAWDKVPHLVDDLVKGWNRDFPSAVENNTKKIPALARFFHRLLSIHPFIDGNGRLARQVLTLQARELFDLSDDILLDRGVPYYRALRKADGGDFSELEMLIGEAIAAVS